MVSSISVTCSVVCSNSFGNTTESTTRKIADQMDNIIDIRSAVFNFDCHPFVDPVDLEVKTNREKLSRKTTELNLFTRNCHSVCEEQCPDAFGLKCCVIKGETNGVSFIKCLLNVKCLITNILVLSKLS